MAETQESDPYTHYRYDLLSRQSQLPAGCHLHMAPLAGFEPATQGLEVPSSVQLSYRGIWCGIRGSNS